jgi:hypothetical protein
MYICIAKMAHGSKTGYVCTQLTIAHLCPDECLKAGLKVVDAAVVELSSSLAWPGANRRQVNTSTKHTSLLWSLNNHIPATFSGMSSVNNHEKQ